MVPSAAIINPNVDHPSLDPYEYLYLVRNPDGSVTRLLSLPTLEPNPEAINGEAAVSKDLPLNSEKKTFIRIYRPTKLPSNDNTVARLPIIFNFHAGGFIYFRVSTRESHELCSAFASETPSIVISVDYRLAPEHRLPAAYEDAIDAILWTKKQFTDKNGEQWVKDYGDFSRCYLSGRGSGGNIAFNTALMALDMDINPIKISGLILNQPMFGGCKRNTSELQHADDPLLPLPAMDLIWKLCLPVGSNRDHPYCNPLVEGPHKEKLGSLAKCFVFGFCGDAMAERMQDFVTLLVMAGVRVQACFNDDGFHNFDIVDKRWARALLLSVKQFID